MNKIIQLLWMRAINCLDGIFTETASKKTEILQENDGVAHNNFLFFLAGAKQDLNLLILLLFVS